MKKLTAGIFATLLAVVSTGAANADIASSGYVDEQVGTRVAQQQGTNDGVLTTDASGRVQVSTGIAQSQVTGLETALNAKANAADVYDKTTADGKFQTIDKLTNAASWEADKALDDQYPSNAAVDAAITSATENLANETTIEEIKTDITTIESDLDKKQDKNMGAEAANRIVTTDATGNITSSATIEATKVTGLADVATTGSYDDLSGTPTLGALAAKDKVAAGDITAGAISEADLNATINASLDKADTAVQPAAITDMQVKSNLTNAAEWATDKENDDKYPSNAAVNAAIEDATSGLATDDKIGDLSTLKTDEKGTLVGAINEVDTNADAAKTAADAAQADATQAINDAAGKIPLPDGDCADPTNKCVLVSNGTDVFEWEVIERGAAE